jgi:hypothetical protein
MYISGVQTVLPEHRYGQEEITEAFSQLTAADGELLKRFHLATGVTGRNFALPLDDYAKLDSFDRANEAYVEVALDLGERAIAGALEKAGSPPEKVDLLVFCSTTGLATPSLDARLAQRAGLRTDVKRRRGRRAGPPARLPARLARPHGAARLCGAVLADRAARRRLGRQPDRQRSVRRRRGGRRGDRARPGP